MTSATQTFRQAANSPVGRQATETAKSIGEEVSDFAGDVGRMASKQYGRAQIWLSMQSTRLMTRSGAIHSLRLGSYGELGS